MKDLGEMTEMTELVPTILRKRLVWQWVISSALGAVHFVMVRKMRFNLHRYMAR